MSFHYRRILETNFNCPVTVAHGPSGTRKTTALLSELSLFGGQKNPKKDQRKPRINFGKADSSYWLRRPTVSEKHQRAAH